MENENFSLLIDFYELTMSYVYFKNNNINQEATFELYYRNNPDNSSYSVFAGLERIINIVKNFKFSTDDINYLKSTNYFSLEFLDYLKNFKFTGDIYSRKEGSVIFPNEPILIVKAKIIEAQLLETIFLNVINHETLIATKANRIVLSACGKDVLEFGARRAHNTYAAIYGSRAAYIGGVSKTSNTLAGKLFNIGISGTMAHSFILSYDSEYEAFLAYAKEYKDNCVLLLDTYDTIKSGLANAIKVHKEYLVKNNSYLKAVRIDSGDIARLSKEIRIILDENQMYDTKIIVSNSLDENIITSLINQGAKIDAFGVGENLIVSKSSPVFGGVYKLCSIKENNKYIPKIKRSENIEKISNPGYKELYRVFDINTNMAICDLLTLYKEKIDPTKELKIFHQLNRWKYKILNPNTYYVKKLLEPIFKNGNLIYKIETLDCIRNRLKEELKTFNDEIKRLTNPQTYYVDLSDKLSKLKIKMLDQIMTNK